MRHALLLAAVLASSCKSTRFPPSPPAPAAAPVATTAPNATGSASAPSPGALAAPAATGGGEARTVSDFDQIEVGGAVDVDVADGSPRAVTVTADPDVASHVTTEVVDHRLVIGLDGDVHTGHPITVQVATPDVTRVRVSGASHLRLHGVHGGDLKIETAGAGTVSADGKADHVAIDVAGAGKVHTESLTTPRADVKVDGAGKARVFASEALTADAAGAGSIRYAGHPAKVEPHASGAGSIAAE